MVKCKVDRAWQCWSFHIGTDIGGHDMNVHGRMFLWVEQVMLRWWWNDWSDAAQTWHAAIQSEIVGNHMKLQGTIGVVVHSDVKDMRLV